MKRPKKNQRVEGTIVSIAYGDGKLAYAQLLPEGWIRIFASPAEQAPPDVERIVASPELFRVAMHPALALSGRWPVVGHVPLRPEDRLIPDRFVQDFTRPENIRIYSSTSDGGESVRPATIEECEGLEAVTVWDPVHVEQRLADRDAGVPNLALLSQRLVHPGDVFTIFVDRGLDAAGRWVVSGRAHTDVQAGDRLVLGSQGGLLVTVAAITEYTGEGALPSIPAGLSGVLHLAGEVPPGARSERVLRRVEPSVPPAERKLQKKR